MFNLKNEWLLYNCTIEDTWGGKSQISNWKRAERDYESDKMFFYKWFLVQDGHV